MPWKKNDDGSLAVGSDGGPVRLENGTEVEYSDSKLDGLFSSLSKANREAAERKRTLRAMEETYAPLKEIPDVSEWIRTATAAMEKNSGHKKPEDETAKLKESYTHQLSEKQKEVDAITDKYHHAVIASKFAMSPVLKNTILPPDVAEAYFGKHFTVQDGEVVGRIGEDIINAPGTITPADFDAALNEIINRYPMKDSILRSGDPGSGTPPNGNSAPSVKEITRKQFDSMSHGARKEFFSNGGKVTD